MCFPSHPTDLFWLMSMSDNLSVFFFWIYKEGRSRFSKLDDEETQTVLSKHDIVGLAETHCSYSDLLHLPGYTCHMNIRPKSPSARKHSGGISVLIKDQIRPGITYMPITNSEFMWMRLDKKNFNMDNHLYIAVVYICPQYSSFSYKSGIFELIEHDISKYSKDGSNCLVCGDFNARTSDETDYCSADNINNYLQLPNSYIQDVPLARMNLDPSELNCNGEKLPEMCKSSGIRIINGRFLGDSLGNPTCYSPNGSPSTIDYMLMSSSALNMIRSFEVNNLTTSSIHCSLSLKMKMAVFKTKECKQSDTNQLPKFYWHAGDDEKFLHSLHSPDISKELNNFESCLSPNAISAGDIDSNAKNFNEILTKSAEMAGIKQRHSKRSSVKTKKIKRNKNWYDVECKKSHWLVNSRRNCNATHTITVSFRTSTEPKNHISLWLRKISASLSMIFGKNWLTSKSKIPANTGNCLMP